MSFTLHVEVVPLGLASLNCPEDYFCPQLLPSARKDSDCDNPLPSLKEQVGPILQIRREYNSALSASGDTEDVGDVQRLLSRAVEPSQM